MLINRDSLLSSAGKEAKESMVTMQRVHKAVEAKVFDILSSVTPENTKNNPVVIKIFEGITIKAYYQPERKMKPNYGEDIITVAPSIKVKAEVTKNYNQKINAMN